MTSLAFDMADDLRLSAQERQDQDAEARPSVPVAPPSPAEIRPRDPVRIPRIAIQAFCDSPEAAAAVERAGSDRLMARAQVSVQMGGLTAAIAHYQQASTPNLVIVESRASDRELLAGLDRLAEVCDAGTKVMVIGHANDITFFRELMRRGVSEYMLAPVDPVSLIASISDIYGESSSAKLGQVYAFIGAKGGVGSSTLAHNVGWMIARRLSSDVVVADMDLPFGTASLDFNLDAGQGVAEAIQDAGRLDEVLLDRLLAKCGDHLSLLSAPTILEKSYDLQESAIEPLLEVARSSVPYLILDMPHLWTAWAKKAVISADEIVITAAPDLANLRNAKNLVTVLRQARPNDPPPKLVLNQVGLPKRPEIKPADFAKALQLEPLACIPFEASLFGAAANKGQMIAEVSAKGAAPKAFGQISEALTGRQDLKSGRKGMLGLNALFGRLGRNQSRSSGKSVR